MSHQGTPSRNVSFTLALEDTKGERQITDDSHFSIDQIMKEIKEILTEDIELFLVDVKRLRKIEIWISKGDDITEPVDNDIIWSKNKRGDVKGKENRK